MCARCSCGSQSNQSNGPGTADNGATTKVESSSADAVKNNAQRLEEGALSKRYVGRKPVAKCELLNAITPLLFGGSLVKPFGWVDFVSLNRSRVGIDAGELDVFAEIILAV